MHQKRLLILHINNDLTNDWDLKAIANKFVSYKLFGRFVMFICTQCLFQSFTQWGRCQAPKFNWEARKYIVQAKS